MQFPQNPDVGDVHPTTPDDIAASGGRKWEYDGIKWNLMTNPVSDVTFTGQLPVVVDQGSRLDPNDNITLIPYVDTSFDVSGLPKLS